MRTGPNPGDRLARGLGPRFRLLWAGQSLSLIGDQITLIALPLVAVRYLRAGTFDIGVLGACLRFPFLVLGLPAGVWVTRAGLIRSMLAADVVRGLAAALMPALLLGGTRSIAVVLAGGLVLGAGTVFFQVAYQSVVPELIAGPERWHAANTRLSLSESMSMLAGPALGGLVVAVLSPASGLGLDAVSYAVSVASLAALLRARRRRPQDGSGAEAGAAPARVPLPRVPLHRQIAGGIRYVRGNPVLNAIMWTGALYNLGAAMYDSLLVVFSVRLLHLSPAVLGLAVGIGSVGFPIGSVISKYANARLGLGPSLVWAAIPSVGGLLVAALAAHGHPEAYLAGGTFLVGLGQGCFAVNAITLRQLNATPAMRPQATSVHRFVSWGALPVGSLAAGTIGAALGLRTAMVTAGIVAALCFWPLLTSPLRTNARRPGDGTERDPAEPYASTI
jgi:MFS family permease